jgi:hypothetical protein
VSPVQGIRTPRGVLYRIGRLPDPGAFPPWHVQGHGRFDDPQREFRVLYAASQRRGAFVETLAQFRPLLAAVARLEAVVGADQPLPRGAVPSDWYQRHAVVRLRVTPGQRWLDLRAPATREVLRAELAATLLTLGFSDLDLGHVLGPAQAVTQAISCWAHQHGYAGLAYTSRLDAKLTLWALFEGAAFASIGEPDPITPDDPDLAATARLYGLVVSH